MSAGCIRRGEGVVIISRPTDGARDAKISFFHSISLLCRAPGLWDFPPAFRRERETDRIDQARNHPGNTAPTRPDAAWWLS